MPGLEPNPQNVRLRWATQRVPGQAGDSKRFSIMRALSRRQTATEKGKEGEVEQQLGGGRSGSGTGTEQSESTETDEDLPEQRRVFINTPLPADALDEDGTPSQHFSRNKIRTARYTPLIFIPKNLWLQFHNVANVYFLFVTILAVCINCP